MKNLKVLVLFFLMIILTSCTSNKDLKETKENKKVGVEESKYDYEVDSKDLSKGEILELNKSEELALDIIEKVDIKMIEISENESISLEDYVYADDKIYLLTKIEWGEDSFKYNIYEYKLSGDKEELIYTSLGELIQIDEMTNLKIRDNKLYWQEKILFDDKEKGLVKNIDLGNKEINIVEEINLSEEESILDYDLSEDYIVYFLEDNLGKVKLNIYNFKREEEKSLEDEMLTKNRSKLKIIDKDYISYIEEDGRIILNRLPLKDGKLEKLALTNDMEVKKLMVNDEYFIWLDNLNKLYLYKSDNGKINIIENDEDIDFAIKDGDLFLKNQDFYKIDLENMKILKYKGFKDLNLLDFKIINESLIARSKDKLYIFNR